MNKIIIKEATKTQNGLIAVYGIGCWNSLKLRKVSFSGNDRGCIGQINRSGFYTYTGNINYDYAIESKKPELIALIEILSPTKCSNYNKQRR